MMKKGNVEFVKHTGLHMEHDLSIIGKIFLQSIIDNFKSIIGNFKSIIGISLARIIFIH